MSSQGQRFDAGDTADQVWVTTRGASNKARCVLVGVSNHIASDLHLLCHKAMLESLKGKVADSFISVTEMDGVQLLKFK